MSGLMLTLNSAVSLCQHHQIIKRYTAVATPTFRTPDALWKNIGGAFKLEGSKQVGYATTGVVVTAIRVLVGHQDDALDEVEVFGKPVHDTSLSVVETLEYVKTAMENVEKDIAKLDASNQGGESKGIQSMQVFGGGNIYDGGKLGDQKWTRYHDKNKHYPTHAPGTTQDHPFRRRRFPTAFFLLLLFFFFRGC